MIARRAGAGRLGLREAWLLGLMAAGCSCGVATVPLMPTPVLFTEVGIDPLGHIPEGRRWTPRRVYYATVRERAESLQRIDYTNKPSDQISFGMTLIGFGAAGTSWAELSRASTQATRSEEIDLSIAGVVEGGRTPRDASALEAASASGGGWLLADLNQSIERSVDEDLLVYVHGAKVNFYNACAYAAQLDHFMGRDMTAFAFSWPTRQNIFAYGTGGDVERAYESAVPLATLLEMLAGLTTARRIHVLSWSAGARVTTAALRELRERHADEPLEALRERLRLGTVYYAAGDVPRDEFLDALPVVHGLASRTVVTMSSGDEALVSAESFMGGGTRLGQTGGDPLEEADLRMLRSLERLEVVDVSAGREERGFDITGHRYWFSHPWASSDVLLAVRTDLPAAERGLVQGELPVLWSMPADYPQRLGEALRAARGKLRRGRAF